MVCCVRQASTGEYPIGRGQPNRKVRVKNKVSFFLFINFFFSIFKVNHERTKTKRRR